MTAMGPPAPANPSAPLEWPAGVGNGDGRGGPSLPRSVRLDHCECQTVTRRFPFPSVTAVSS